MQAQEGMWAAAFVLVVITFFQFIASLFGLFFILMTYREARYATGAANRAATASENAERAYLTIDFELRFPDDAEDRDFSKFAIDVFVTNYGKTPAYSVDWFTEHINPRPQYLFVKNGALGMVGSGRAERVKVISFPAGGYDFCLLNNWSYLHSLELRGIWSGFDVWGKSLSGEIDVRLQIDADDSLFLFLNNGISEPGVVIRYDDHDRHRKEIGSLRFEVRDRRTDTEPRRQYRPEANESSQS